MNDQHQFRVTVPKKELTPEQRHQLAIKPLPRVTRVASTATHASGGAYSMTTNFSNAERGMS